MLEPAETSCVFHAVLVTFCVNCLCNDMVYCETVLMVVGVAVMYGDLNQKAVHQSDRSVNIMVGSSNDGGDVSFYYLILSRCIIYIISYYY